VDVRHVDHRLDDSTRKGFTSAVVYSDRVAAMFGVHAEQRIIPVRGSWFQLKAEHRSIVARNIYPVPNSAFPFLGVHFTPTVGGDCGGSAANSIGGMIVGPNAMLATSRAGYGLSDFSLADTLELIRDPPLRTLIRQHWRYGLTQLVDELFPHFALAACQSYVPSLRWDHLQLYRPISWLPHYSRPLLRSGVRAQALTADGRLEEDFVIQVQHRINDVAVEKSPDDGGADAAAAAATPHLTESDRSAAASAHASPASVTPAAAAAAAAIHR
jgi:L-2-hydroxyglutarate oxidase